MKVYSKKYFTSERANHKMGPNPVTMILNLNILAIKIKQKAFRHNPHFYINICNPSIQSFKQ